MAKTTELVHRGLYTARDPVLMPMGGLQKARNSRYRVGDPAVWQAGGRQPISALTASTSSYTHLAPINWDIEEVRQLILADGGPFQITRLSGHPEDATFSLSNLDYRNYNTSTSQPQLTTFAPGSGVGHVTVIPFRDKWVLCWGQQPLLVQRKELRQLVYVTRDANNRPASFQLGTLLSNQTHARKLGLPLSHIDEKFLDFYKTHPLQRYEFYTGTQIKPVETAGGTNFFPVGFHDYWMTWYDAIDNIEGAATVFAVGTAVVTGSTIDQIELYVRKDEFDRLRPENATHVRVYKSATYGAEELADYTLTLPTLGSEFPNGYLIAEIEIGTIVATTPTQQMFGPREVGGSGGKLYDTYLITANGYPVDARDANWWNHNDAAARTDDFITNLQPYDTGALVIGNLLTTVNTNGPAPQASCGSVFEGALVLNDMENPNLIHYSRFDNPDNFATLDITDMMSKEAERVTGIWGLGRVCGVFLQHSIYRLNWLARVTDASALGRGTPRDVVSESHGCVWEGAITSMQYRGQPMIAAVDFTGVYVTDLDHVKLLTNHVDWKAMVGAPAGLPHNCWLVNNQNEQRLELWVRRPVGATVGWFIHYDEAHTDEDGNPAVTGPIEREGISDVVHAVVDGGQTRTFVAALNSKLYIEDEGYTDDGKALEWEVETRDIYPNGLGSEAFIRQVATHLKPSNAGGGSYDLNMVVGDTRSEQTVRLDTIEPGKRISKVEPMLTVADYVALNLKGTSGETAMALNVFALDHTGYGDAE